MPRFRKNPVTIEAIQWNGNSNRSDIETFVGEELSVELFSETAYIAGQGAPLFSLVIKTNEGDMRADPNDWIIKEPFPTSDRKFYPCKPDIFSQTYRQIKELKAEVIEISASPISKSNWIEITEDTLPEETEPVLWATFPVVEPPEVASMCDEDFTYERFTHYRRMTNDFFE